MARTADVEKRSNRSQKSGRTKAPRRRTQAERTALSDQRMYQAAIKLLCEGGIHGTTLKDVGERAGYSRGLATARFATKEGLFASLVKTMNGRWFNEVALMIDKRTGLAAILAFLDAVTDFMRKEPLWTRALFVLWYESVMSLDEVRKAIAESHERQRVGVIALIKQGQEKGDILPEVSPERFAVLYLSMIFGAIYEWHVNPGTVDIETTFQEVRKSVLQLLTQSPPQSRASSRTQSRAKRKKS